MPHMTADEVRRSAPMLAALASMTPATVTAALVEAFQMVPLSADDRRYINAPIVVHEAGGWGAADIPSWMPGQIRAERLEIILGLHPEWLVGPTEIVAVMHAATLAAPLQRDISDLYVWASVQAMARKTGTPVEETWAAIRPVGTNEPPIPDSAVLARGGRLHMTYLGLSQEIRRKVDRVQAGLERAERRSAAEAPIIPA